MEEWLDAAHPTRINVLHLDDDSDIADLTKEYLEHESAEFDVSIENHPEDALQRIEEDEFDVIVSDYDMPQMDGLDFLDAVREDHPDLPFILFTGKGSEEIASEAISRGVTDYLEKYGGGEQYTVLANRIENAVNQARAERLVERRSEWYRRILEYMSDYVMIVNDMGEVRYVSPAIERVMGYDQDEIIGTDSFENIHPDDLQRAADAMGETIEDPEKEATVEFRAQAADGTYRWLEVRGRNYREDPLIQGIMVNVRDITQRKEREREIERQNERLDEFVSVASHDLRNPLNVAMGRLDMARDTYDDEHLEMVDSALDRMNDLIENLLMLARSGQEVQEEVPVNLGVIMEDSWRNVNTEDASLVIESDLTVKADESRLQQIVENLVSNAVEYGGPGVTVTLGTLDDGTGFYIQDDGVGIPKENREKIFESGFSTSRDGAGFGLSIVREIANAHGWEVTVTESEDGGARFEFTGVELELPASVRNT